MTEFNAEDFLSVMLPDNGSNLLIDLLRREIWISGGVFSGISRPVVRGLKQMAQLSNSPITVYINSEGGDPYEALVITDVMRSLSRKKIQIRTSVMGVAYSAGLIISSAGTHGQRTAIPSADFLIHQLSVDSIGGKMEDVEAATQSLKRLNDKIGDFFTEVTGLRKSQVTDLMAKESYLDNVNARSLGFIDRVAIPGIDEGE